MGAAGASPAAGVGTAAAATRDAAMAATDRAAAIPTPTTTTTADPVHMVRTVGVGEVEAAGRAMAATGLVVAAATVDGKAVAVTEAAAGPTAEVRAAATEAAAETHMAETATASPTMTDIRQFVRFHTTM